MSASYDLVCFSHLRWDFVFQRPQHLLSRAARDRRVFFVEEPVRESGAPRVSMHRSPEGVYVVNPILPRDTPAHQEPEILRGLVDRVVEEQRLLVLHADGAAVRAPPAAEGGGVRLHG
jgi:hypothetical protein